MIHNHNEQQITWHRPIDSTEQNWFYALPEEINAQILKHEVNSPSTKVLFEILSEQISIFTTDDINWRNFEDYSESQIEQYYFKRNILRKTSTIQGRLKQVVEKLQCKEITIQQGCTRFWSS